MTQLLDPETEQSTAKEIAHRGKGCLAVIVAFAVLVVGGYLLWDRGSGFIAGIGEVPDYAGPGGAAVTVVIPKGSSVSDIGSILVDGKVIASTKAWDKAVAAEPDATSIQAGSYKLRSEVPAQDALATLLEPGDSMIRDTVTVPEGLRLSAQIPVLAKGSTIKQSDFRAALRKPKTLGLPAYAKNNPEGYLFPDTYQVTADADATAVLQQMTGQFTATATRLDLDARARALGITTGQLVTVASIIEREVRVPEDRAKVARVLYNRLAQKKNLELNSTLVYAKGYKSENQITDADIAADIAYNTYQRPGLPPGPISAPGAAALEAAANPADGSWIYFVTVNCDSGKTLFSTDYSEQQRNEQTLRAWQSENPGRC